MRKLDQLRDPQCLAGWLRQITAHGPQPPDARGPVHGAEAGVLETRLPPTRPADTLVRDEERPSSTAASAA